MDFEYPQYLFKLMDKKIIKILQKKKKKKKFAQLALCLKPYYSKENCYLYHSSSAQFLQAELTHLWWMYFPILINFGVVGWYFYLYSKLKGNFCLQTVENLIRRHVLQRLIWHCLRMSHKKDAWLIWVNLKMCIIMFTRPLRWMLIQCKNDWLYFHSINLSKYSPKFANIHENLLTDGCRSYWYTISSPMSLSLRWANKCWMDQLLKIFVHWKSWS